MVFADTVTRRRVWMCRTFLHSEKIMNGFRQTCGGRRTLLWLAIVWMAGAAWPLRAEVQTNDGGPQTRLNARDFGASGSKFETTASATEGSRQITVKDAGDFKAGQGIMVSKCNVRYSHKSLWGPRKKFAASRPIKDEVEARGYDGTAGSWVVYVLDVPLGKREFRWTDDLGRTWQPSRPITREWQPLSGKTEVRFGELDWESGYTVVLTARDQLMTTIEKIEGNVLTVRDPANRTVADAVARHCDDAALQAAVDRAVKEKKDLYVPVGHYRLARGITVKDAGAITIEGQSAVDTVLDISEGEGACISLKDGEEATVRNFSMIGHMGFDQRDQAGAMRTMGGTAVWGFYFKRCNALNVSGTERVLVENCHAVRMSCESFYSQGPGRWKGREPKKYTKALTFLRCSVTDCARNAFNNNDFAENTSVLYCRIVDVGGCSWEGASRFVRFIGNYVRNGGTVAMGNIGSREEHLEVLGSAQHIIADNVFESSVPYGGCAIRAAHGATQVVIRNNLFVNFGSSAVEVWGAGDDRHLPAGIVTVTGNIFDMTSFNEKQVSRFAVNVSAADTIVSDNQIYVRGKADPLVTGIAVSEPAVNVAVHNNLIRNCGTGIATGRSKGIVGEVVDPSTFLCGPAAPLLERRKSHLFRGWSLAWLSGSRPNTLAVIDSFDPETLRFKLRAPQEMNPGDRFEVFPPSANWNIHSNTITGCLRPVTLDSFGSETSLFCDNIVSRGDAEGVKEAVEVRGLFKLIGNHISGFDETGAAAIGLYPDRVRETCPNTFRNNILQRCAAVVKESRKGLWEACAVQGNLFIDCGNAPAQAPTAEQKVKAVLVEAPKRRPLRAARAKSPVVVDGAVTEWAWDDATRVGVLQQTPAGGPLPAPRGSFCAAWDDAGLYVAVRIPLAKNAKARGGSKWGDGDGVEVSFQGADGKTPIYLFWGAADGRFEVGPYGGAPASQVEALQKTAAYAARIGGEEWTCEWRIPLGPPVGLAQAASLRFNIGAHIAADDAWVAWVGTGGTLYQVERAGDLVLER